MLRRTIVDLGLADAFDSCHNDIDVATLCKSCLSKLMRREGRMAESGRIQRARQSGQERRG